jgi:cobalamin biosynthesis protein CobW
VPALEKLLEPPNPPQHILIETSGLALPKPLVKAFNWPAIRSRVTVDGVIAVVDGPAVAEGQFADDPEALAAQQAARRLGRPRQPAGGGVRGPDPLRRPDPAQQERPRRRDRPRARVKAEIAQHLPKAIKIVETAHGKVEPALVIGLGAAAEDDLAARPSHHGEARITTTTISTASRCRCRRAAHQKSCPPASPRRPKPRACCASRASPAVPDKPMRLVVQGVGRRVGHHYDRAWNDGEARDGRLVVIGLKGFDRAAVEAALHDG